MDDLRYYDIMNPKGRKTAKKTPDRDSLGIGTRSCFAFRPPRTITTADMSVEDIDTNSHPSDEKLGLLQSLEPAAITRSWTYSSADTTANLTSMQSSQISSPANTISTAERGGYSSSGGDSSLLSMPTPTDRSHRRRLKMERGGQVHKYDGEQEPAGYRGQEAALNAPVTPSPRAQPNNLLAMPASKDRSRRRREGNINRYQGELDPTGNWEQESPPTTPMAPAPQGSLKLLAMPTPTDRSQVRRLQHERNGKGSAYEGEQEPTGFRGQEAVTPVNATYRGGENRNLLALPTSTDRSHRKRAEQERRGRSNAYAGKQQPMGHESRISSDNLPEPIFRTPIASGRLRRDPSGLIGAPKHPNESFLGDDSPTKGTGSPYLQFSTDGPALRVFETSPKRLISPNSSMMDTSVESSDQIRWMVKDLVPLSASAEKKIKNRVAAYQPTQGDLQIAPAPPKRKLKPILKAPSVRSDYSVANTHDTSIWSGVVDGQSSLGPLTVTVSPERSAFAVIRGSPSGGEVSVSSASTRSSVTLRDMMNDLVEDSATAASGRSGPITDIDEMAASAQSHVEQGEYDLALVLFGRILALQRRQYGNVHPLVASAYHNLGIVHSQRGSLLLEGTLQQKHVRQQSLQCFQAAARTARDSLGRNHPNVAVSLVKIGFLLLQARQYEPALVTFEEALRIRLVAFGGNPNQLTANLYNNLGICLLHLQRFDESKLNLNKALGIQRHMLRVERLACTRDDLQVRLLEVADTLANLGGLGLEWLRQEGPQQEIMWEAESQLAEALEIRSTVLGYHHPLALQVKSLHDMVQSTPSLVGERNLPPSNAKLQTSSSARSLTRGLPKEAIHPSNQGYQSSPPTMSRGLPVSRVLSLTYSPERSLNTSSDAPAPKAYSPSPVIELLAQHLKADARDESTSVSPRMRISVDSTSLSRSRAIPLVPPVSEVVVEEEEDGGQGSNRIPERTKIFVSPHYVPRKSPTRKFSSKDESNYSDLKTPPLVSSSGFECSDRRQSQSRAYDTEESCLLNQSGDRIDLLSRFLVNSDEDNEDGLNLSSHEIMIVRPSSTSGMSPDVPGPLAQPLPRTINGQWKGDINRNTQQQQPSVRGKEQLDESDDGIAPLSRSEKTKRDQKMHLSEDMLENPEPHIVDIYAAASRYLKVRRDPSNHDTMMPCQTMNVLLTFIRRKIDFLKRSTYF
jgi:tetratricopeptide (TPR) repeat protein